MNWGKKITVLYLSFVALIIGLVYTSVTHPSELEYKDYYARELKYQDMIDATKNANNLEAPITYEVKGNSIAISVPTELWGAETSGKITLLRPSDASLDREYAFKSDAEGKQLIEDQSLQNGVYRMAILLEKNKQHYYKEAVIQLH